MTTPIIQSSKPCVTFIGSYLPRRCGIATFTHDLASTVSQDVYRQSLVEGDLVDIVAMNDRDDEYEYDPQVAYQIQQHRKEDYRSAADYLNQAKTDVVSLQHEYGLFGGPDGSYLLELLERLTKPVVTTLHTVLQTPSEGQRQVLSRICELSHSVAVMSERAKEYLVRVYGADGNKIHLIHHGTPDVPFENPNRFKARFGLEGRPVILTFGLLNPNKGIEGMLDSLAKVVPDFPDLAYLVLGITHPLVRRESGESYRFSLESRVVKLGIQRNVIFHNRYVSLSDLCEYLMAADIYVTPYREESKQQIVSGTLAYALSTGRAIVSTPYYYAQELLAEGRGRLVDFSNVDAMAGALHELLANPTEREKVRRSAYAYGRTMIWPAVGRQYVDLFHAARQESIEITTTRSPDKRVLTRMSLPEVRLQHMEVMTDDTGLVQHAVYSTPDRRHGYSMDDNARAVIVNSSVWSLFKDESVLANLQTYLSYLHHGYNEATGRFRNFLSFDRRWLDEEGSDDVQGRVLWALGELIAKAPNESFYRLADELFDTGVDGLRKVKSIRGKAFAILGITAYLKKNPDSTILRSELARLAGEIAGEFAAHESPDWPWYEDIVTYDNARLPEAMILAGLELEDEKLVNDGVRILKWLLSVQTAEEGCLSLIGNEGWLRKGAERPAFDQQPVEVAALVSACRAAFEATQDTHWLAEMRRCFEWFLGRNDRGCLLINFKTRGCHDGLTASGVNANQGAESLLAWLQSLLIMHEVQTADAPETELVEATDESELETVEA